MKNLKVWPDFWSNRIEIISIPFAFKKNGNWFLRIHYLDLDENIISGKHCSLPLEMAPYLKIGAELGNNFAYTKESGQVKTISIDSFEKGTIEVLKNLNRSIYRFNIAEELSSETHFFRIILQGETYLFFCYELYRKFLLNISFLGAYTMNPQDLLLLIDNYKTATTPANERKLELFFNIEVPVNILTHAFIKQFTLIQFHPQFNNFVSNVLKAQEHPYSRNHFHFLQTPLPSLEIMCRVKRVHDLNIVFEIKEIHGIQLPFDIIDASHPNIKNPITTKTDKKQFVPTSDPANHEVNHDGEGYNPSKGPKTAYVDGFSIILGNNPKIRRLEPETNSTNTAKQRVGHPDPDETEQLALNSPISGSDKTLLNIETTNKIKIINPEDIPEGLRLFAKSIERVTAVLKSSFTYDLIELAGKFKCSCIQNQPRKVMLIVFELASKFYYILEADPSEIKQLSTLIIKSDESLELSKIVQGIPEFGCTWPIQTLKSLNLNYRKLKHPYIRTKEPPLPEEDKTSYKIARHAENILYVLNEM